MKEWESQNLISLLRLQLRAQAIKELISVWCVQGTGNSHPRFLPWAESWEVKSSAQQAGVGLTACPPAEDGAAHGMSPMEDGAAHHVSPLRRMGLLMACPPQRMGLVTACPPAEDRAGQGVSPRGGWGCSWHVPPWRTGLVTTWPLAEDGAAHGVSPCRGGLVTACPPAEDGVAHGMCVSPHRRWGWPLLGTGKGSLGPVWHFRGGSPWKGSLSAASFTLGWSKGSDPEGAPNLHRASALQRVQVSSAICRSPLPVPGRLCPRGKGLS